MWWLVWYKKPKITHLKSYGTTLERYFIHCTRLRLTIGAGRQQKETEKYGPIML